MKKEKMLTIDTYNRTAKRYTTNFFDDTKDETPYLDKFFKTLPKGAKVLDAGCGPGTFSKIVINNGFECYGMDLSEEMIKIAREKLPTGHFDIMDLNRLTYDNASFDAIIAMYSIIHLSSAEVPAVLKRFYEILDENGKLFIAVQSGKVEEVRQFGVEGEAFVHFYEVDALNKFLKDANFKIAQQDSIDWVNPTDNKPYKILFTSVEKESQVL